MPVEAVAVTVAPIERRLTAVGTLRSNESVILRPEVAGRIAAIDFLEGQPVDEGQVLFELDASVNRAEIASIEATLELSRANFERASGLVQRGTGTRATYDAALAEQRANEARLQLAQAQLAKLTITAPFAGVMGLRRVSVGDFVDRGDEMVNLEQIDPLKVDFRVAENFLAAVAPGQAIEVQVDAFDRERFRGEVYAIDPLVDESGRSIVLRARLPNPDQRLRPGLFARVELVLNEKPAALLLPEQALIPEGAEQFVYRVVDGKATRTPVETGLRREGMVEITAGLTAADVVVVAGQLKIRDGAPVQIAPPPPAA
ncbi:MAG TPA: efflux RND transporter periplasmic adaptor subunit [Geminicoccaceae bacterium]|nr:efflux RND transporter periplasmic adaptor subunit [Geminicoccaceae bacterium]